METKNSKPDNTSEKFAVDEIIAREEVDFFRHTPNSLCPQCGTDVDTDENEIDDDLVECVDYCRHCGWESDPYYV